MERMISFVGASALVAMLAMSAAGCARMNQMTGGVTSPSTSFAAREPSTGFSGIAPMPKTNNPEKPPPAIQNCALVAISTPSRWACNGKTYTAYELAKARMDWEKKYGSGQ
ncbi:MAG TPA: hypothetical protein VIX59_04805 [Candidatus Binataceae bacterium]